MGGVPTTVGTFTTLRARVTRQSLPHSALSMFEAEAVLVVRVPQKGHGLILETGLGDPILDHHFCTSRPTAT